MVRAARQFSTAIGMIGCLFTVESSAQYTANVFRRVLMIKVGDAVATSFTIEVDNKQYLVTAKHVVAGLEGKGKIDVRRDDKWLRVDVIVQKCADPIDIAH